MSAKETLSEAVSACHPLWVERGVAAASFGVGLFLTGAASRVAALSVCGWFLFLCDSCQTPGYIGGDSAAVEFAGYPRWAMISEVFTELSFFRLHLLLVTRPSIIFSKNHFPGPVECD